jgi:PAS domain S-box-containing protein
MMVIGVAGAIAIVEAARELPGVTLDRNFGILAALTLASGLVNFRIPSGRFTFSISDTFTMTVAVLFGAAPATVLVGLDGLAMSARLAAQNRSIARILYNATAPALAMWIAAHVFTAIQMSMTATQQDSTTGLVVAVIVFSALYFVLNTGFIALAVSGERHQSIVAVWRTHFATLWVTYVVGASAAGLVALLVGAGGPGSTAIILLMPVVFVLYSAARGAAERVRERWEHQAERDLYATALRSTADAVLLTDPHRRVTFMNPAAQRLTGWTDAESRGRRDSEVFQVSDAAGTPAGDLAAREAGVMAQFVLTRRDGSQCPIEEMHAPIRDDDGHLRGVIWTFRDIRERKAAEAEREALLVMEREAHASAVAANRMKDEFLAVVSHELRTPATAILGWTHILRARRMDSQGTEQALAALERSARVQATVLNDLVDSSQMVGGALRLRIGRTDVMTPLNEALETLEPASQAKQLRVEVSAESGLPMIDADPDRLRQVFWNLVSNAIKFTPPRGHIQLIVRQRDGSIEIEVRDNGRGIDPVFLPYVFDRFRQADASASRAHGGLGLGLAIVKHIVESHGGTVDVSSDGPGRGACFTVRLPSEMRRREPDHTSTGASVNIP